MRFNIPFYLFALFAAISAARGDHHHSDSDGHVLNHELRQELKHKIEHHVADFLEAEHTQIVTKMSLSSLKVRDLSEGKSLEAIFAVRVVDSNCPRTSKSSSRKGGKRKSGKRSHHNSKRQGCQPTGENEKVCHVLVEKVHLPLAHSKKHNDQVPLVFSVVFCLPRGNSGENIPKKHSHSRHHTEKSFKTKKDK